MVKTGWGSPAPRIPPLRGGAGTRAVQALPTAGTFCSGQQTTGALMLVCCPVQTLAGLGAKGLRAARGQTHALVGEDKRERLGSLFQATQLGSGCVGI